MAAEGHFADYDVFLRLLGEAQRYKLRVNAHKGWIGAVPPNTLLKLLKKEVEELAEATSRTNTLEMILEAADVANFALGLVISAMNNLDEGLVNVFRARISGDGFSSPVEHPASDT